MLMISLKNKIKERLKDNSGFSLTELIVVIAIIVIMTGASFLIISVVHGARAKDAASTFESALADTINSSKNMNAGIDLNLDGSIDSSEKKYVPGLQIHKVGNKYYLQKCVFIYYSDTGSYALYNLHEDNEYIKSVNENNGKGISLSSYVKVEYYGVSGNKMPDLSEYTSYTICYNQRGECVAGAGTYKFLKSSTGDSIVTVTVNKNGGYISK